MAQPVVLVEAARISKGTFTPVTRLDDFLHGFDAANFADVSEVAIRNRTTDQEPQRTLRRPDGFIAALVPVREGENTIEFSAHSLEGAVATRALRITIAGSVESPLTPELTRIRRSLEDSGSKAAGNETPPLPSVGAPGGQP